MILGGGRQHTQAMFALALGLIVIVGAFVLSWYGKDGTTYSTVTLPVFAAIAAALLGSGAANYAESRRDGRPQPDPPSPPVANRTDDRFADDER